MSCQSHKEQLHLAISLRLSSQPHALVGGDHEDWRLPQSHAIVQLSTAYLHHTAEI